MKTYTEKFPDLNLFRILYCSYQSLIACSAVTETGEHYRSTHTTHYMLPATDELYHHYTQSLPFHLLLEFQYYYEFLPVILILMIKLKIDRQKQQLIKDLLQFNSLLKHKPMPLNGN